MPVWDLHSRPDPVCMCWSPVQCIAGAGAGKHTAGIDSTQSWMPACRASKPHALINLPSMIRFAGKPTTGHWMRWMKYLCGQQNIFWECEDVELRGSWYRSLVCFVVTLARRLQAKSVQIVYIGILVCVWSLIVGSVYMDWLASRTMSCPLYIICNNGTDSFCAFDLGHERSFMKYLPALWFQNGMNLATMHEIIIWHILQIHSRLC